MFPAVGVSTARCSGGAWKKYSCNEKKKDCIENHNIFKEKVKFPLNLEK